MSDLAGTAASLAPGAPDNPGGNAALRVAAAGAASAEAAGSDALEGAGGASVRGKIEALVGNIEKAIVGKRETVKLILVGLLARGHVLVEDVPGVGKTTLARALAKSIDCKFRRIQFTPDLLPSDVVGVSVFDQHANTFKFHHGPLFANVILADEINRTTPRTQSALLEAMNDFQVSVDGITHELPKPFIVLATENPIEYAGTYPLPEAQLDRFLLRLTIGYPDRDSERRMLMTQKFDHPLNSMKPVITAEEVVQLQEIVKQVKVEDDLLDYILEIAAKTREARALALGVSPRGCLMLRDAARAYAVVEGRKFVKPDDVKKLAFAVLGHRMIEKGRDAGMGRKNIDDIFAEILEEVPVPL
ncbi:MAG: MoxR family ATPase [Planctomycetes bacterium]|nr:MoxR family ATPase [Planctomycetota bacterium]